MHQMRTLASKVRLSRSENRPCGRPPACFVRRNPANPRDPPPLAAFEGITEFAVKAFEDLVSLSRKSFVSAPPARFSPSPCQSIETHAGRRSAIAHADSLTKLAGSLYPASSHHISVSVLILLLFLLLPLRCIRIMSLRRLSKRKEARKPVFIPKLYI
jgi:hypothetical protein